MSQRSNSFRVLPLIVLGAVQAFTFAPAPLPGALLPFIQLLSFSAFVYYMLKAPKTRSALWGAWLFGLSQFSIGLYWFYISMHEYGGMAAPLAGAAVLLFAAFMALYYVLAVATARFFIQRSQSIGWKQQLCAAVVWASAWTLFEWLRGTLFTGFPWLNIAYAHVDGMYAGWATVIGTYGVSWIVAFAAATLALFALNTSKAAPKSHNYPVAITVLCAILGIVLGGIQWSKPHGAPFFVRLTQGNVDQNLKFDQHHLQQGIELYQTLAALPAKTAESTPSLIVLPETVIPLFQHQWPASFWQQWIDIAAAQNATLLLGAPLYAEQGGQAQYTNSAFTITANSTPSAIQQLQLSQRYDKQHLVPFGEFVPPGFRWFVDALAIPLGDFNRGAARQANFAIGSQYIGPNICYEDLFGEEILRSVQENDELGPGATVLVNLSNLGWFGDSWALRQHLQIARMRSIETARPMLRATNTGMTASILANGELQAVLPAHSVSVLDVEVQGMTGFTPYSRVGNSPVIIGALLLLLGLGFKLRSRSQISNS